MSAHVFRLSGRNFQSAYIHGLGKAHKMRKRFVLRREKRPHRLSVGKHVFFAVVEIILAVVAVMHKNILPVRAVHIFAVFIEYDAFLCLVAERPFPIAVAGRIDCAVAAHAPAVVEPPLGIATPSRVGVFQIVVMLTRKNHGKIFELFPTHGDTVIEHHVLAHRTVTVYGLGPLTVLIEILAIESLRVYIPRNPVIRFRLAVIVGRAVMIKRIQILFVYADYFYTLALHDGSIVIYSRRRYVFRQSVKRIVRVTGVFLGIVAITLNRARPHTVEIYVARIDVRL